jgi:hypothetical protein
VGHRATRRRRRGRVLTPPRDRGVRCGGPGASRDRLPLAISNRGGSRRGGSERGRLRCCSSRGGRPRRDCWTTTRSCGCALGTHTHRVGAPLSQREVVTAGALTVGEADAGDALDPVEVPAQALEEIHALRADDRGAGGEDSVGSHRESGRDELRFGGATQRLVGAGDGDRGRLTVQTDARLSGPREARREAILLTAPRRRAKQLSAERAGSIDSNGFERPRWRSRRRAIAGSPVSAR